MNALTLAFCAPFFAMAACGGGSSGASPTSGGSHEGGIAGDEGGAGAAEVACDPLAATPTTLGGVIGVGQGPDGTIYVADDGNVLPATQPQPSLPAPTVRVFVEIGGSLVRQDVVGSGENGGPSGINEDFETFQSADGSTPPQDLDIQISGGKATSMILGAEGSAKGRLSGMDAGTPTALTLLDPSVVKGLPVVDLPSVVGYVADGADGTAIAVTEPLEDDQGSSAFRLFYGPPQAMQERRIVSFNQALSGFPSIGFAFGSQEYVMSISSVPSPDGGPFAQPGPVTLMTGGPVIAYTLRLPTPKTLAGFDLLCLKVWP